MTADWYISIRVSNVHVWMHVHKAQCISMLAPASAGRLEICEGHKDLDLRPTLPEANHKARNEKNEKNENNEADKTRQKTYL